jgi:hypothetical protein
MEIIDMLCADITNNPQDWELGKYELVHKKSSIVIWVANGFWFYSTGNRKFSFVEKIKFHLVFRNFQDMQIKHSLMNKKP